MQYRRTDWFGRSTYRHRYGNSPVQEFAHQLGTVGAEHEAIKQGLFGGRLDRAVSAASDYAERFTRASTGH